MLIKDVTVEKAEILCTREELLKSYHSVSRSRVTLNLWRWEEFYLTSQRNTDLTPKMKKADTAAVPKRRLQSKVLRPGPPLRSGRESRQRD